EYLRTIAGITHGNMLTDHDRCMQRYSFQIVGQKLELIICKTPFVRPLARGKNIVEYDEMYTTVMKSIGRSSKFTVKMIVHMLGIFRIAVMIPNEGPRRGRKGIEHILERRQ